MNNQPRVVLLARDLTSVFLRILIYNGRVNRGAPIYRGAWPSSKSTRTSPTRDWSLEFRFFSFFFCFVFIFSPPPVSRLIPFVYLRLTANCKSPACLKVSSYHLLSARVKCIYYSLYLSLVYLDPFGYLGPYIAVLRSYLILKFAVYVIIL